MGNMSNQQLMQMQLHGMDLQRMGMGMPGGFLAKTLFTEAFVVL